MSQPWLVGETFEHKIYIKSVTVLDVRDNGYMVQGDDNSIYYFPSAWTSNWRKVKV